LEGWPLSTEAPLIPPPALADTALIVNDPQRPSVHRRQPTLLPVIGPPGDTRAADQIRKQSAPAIRCWTACASSERFKRSRSSRKRPPTIPDDSGPVALPWRPRFRPCWRSLGLSLDKDAPDGRPIEPRVRFDPRDDMLQQFERGHPSRLQRIRELCDQAERPFQSRWRGGTRARRSRLRVRNA